MVGARSYRSGSRARDDPGKALRGDRAHDPRAAGDDGVALHGMSRDGRPLRRGAQERRSDEALARELKFARHRHERLADGLRLRRRRSPGRVRRLGGELRARPRRAAPHVHRRRASASCSSQLQHGFDRFMALDAVAWHALQDADPRRHASGSCSGPSCGSFETMATPPTSSPTSRRTQRDGDRRPRLRRRARRRPARG